MKIVSRFVINNNSSLLFAKIEIKNILKRADKNYDYYTFAVMELGTNILKYAKCGEIWLLEEDGEYLLCALDKGEGIKDLKWALQKGNTTAENSLGLGLYQLAYNDYFDFLMFTLTETNIHGSVFMLKPKNLNNRQVFLKENYMGLSHSGDFIFFKGRYVIIGDVLGHGLKASKSVEFLKKFFYDNVFSCTTIDDLISRLHNILKSKALRGFAFSVIEIRNNKISVCGVGNIGIMYKKDKIKYLTQKEGILGEVYSRMSKYEIKTEKNLIFLAFSDGIDEKVLYNIFNKCSDIYLLNVCALYFSERIDDKVIFAYKEM